MVLGLELAVVDSRLADLALAFVGSHQGFQPRLALALLVAGSRPAACRMSLVLVQVDGHSHIEAAAGVPLTTRASSHSLCEP